MALDPDLQWLRDIEQLRALPQRYARAVDARDMDALTTLFHPDGTVVGARGSLAVPAYLDTMRGPRAFESSMHLLGDPLIDLLPGSDEGRMDTYAVVYQLRPAGSTNDDLTLGIRYLDEVVRSENGWVIRHRQSETLWMRPRPE